MLLLTDARPPTHTPGVLFLPPFYFNDDAVLLVAAPFVDVASHKIKIEFSP